MLQFGLEKTNNIYCTVGISGDYSEQDKRCVITGIEKANFLAGV